MLVPTEYGFKHERILDLITFCNDDIQNKDVSALLFLDFIKNAFNSVYHGLLQQKLEHYGIKDMANSIIKTYLKKRKLYVSSANQNSTNHMIEFGVLQGSILGPILLLIYTNHLPSCIQTILIFYVDDTALLISGKSLSDK